ncbi:MAG: alkaline phosphatase family protein [Acidobacteriota bacterium]|nr:MAG: alkaline phosphatase family protein [Acidobacteriota bacterium]
MQSKTRVLLFLSGLLALVFLFSSPSGSMAQAQVRGAELEKPRLVLLISVDQFRSDYLTRFHTAMTGGLAQLASSGVVFSEAHHSHAVTSTGPGHATLSTGAFPSRSGIVGNSWFEENGSVDVYCVEDENSPIVRSSKAASLSKSSSGRSPRNLLVTGLADWIKESDPESKAFSASRKDRASVLMGGKNPDAAFWYDASTGRMVSSSYYMKQLPEWLGEFNREPYPLRYFGEFWKRSETDPTAAMGIEQVDRGWFPATFPYSMGGATFGPTSSFFSDFGGTPFMDDYLVEMAKQIVREEGLGLDDHTDYLGLSFSALDSVGHSFGPHSFEVFDTIVRLDASLGELFRFLDETVGMDRVWIAFSADHGVMDLPEVRRAHSQGGHRLTDEDIACVQNRGQEFLVQYAAEEDWFLSGFYLNYAALGRQNLLRSTVEKDAARLLESCDWIRKVWTKTELEQPSDDPFHELFRNSYHPERSPELLVQTEEYVLTSRGTGTSHGTPYSYDTHVPMVYLIPGIAAGGISERVHTVDVAPTIGSLLGLSLPSTVDGRDLSGHLRKSSD